MKIRLGLFVGGAVFVLVYFFGKPFFEGFKNTDTLLNKIGCRVYEFNSITVESDSLIQMKDIVIKHGGNIVFANGRQQHKLGQQYGHRSFDVYLDERLIAEFSHFSTNNWFCNDYFVKLEKQDRYNTNISYKIIGPSATNDTFQKRYVYDQNGKLTSIEFLSLGEMLYHTNYID